MSHLLNASNINLIQKVCQTSLLKSRSITYRDIDIQDLYTAMILYVLTIGVAKFSVTAFLARLASASIHKIIVVILGGFVVAWTIAALLGTSFECVLPHPWETFTSKCISFVRLQFSNPAVHTNLEQMPFWFTLGTVDMLTDLFMVILPIQMVWGLQMELDKKALVMGIFAIRLM